MALRHPFFNTAAKLKALFSQQSSSAELIEEIENKFTYMTLLSNSKKDQFILQQLRSTGLRSYWIKKLKEIAEFDNEFSFQPDPACEPFDQVQGIHIFTQVLELRQQHEEKPIANFGEKEWALLLEANSLGNFDAARAIQEKLIQNIDSSTIKMVTDHAVQAANRHLTPGHLLAAEAYYHAANFHAENKKNEEHDQALLRVIYHLKMAQELESVAKVSIHNAYYGRSALAAIADGLAITLNVPAKSWDELIAGFIKASGLPGYAVDSIIKLAVDTAKSKTTVAQEGKKTTSLQSCVPA